MINSYSSIYNLGHSAIADLLKEPVIVEEKIDGSQISFRKTQEGELQLRSKGAQINLVAPEGMFTKAVETVKEIADRMVAGVTYRGEYLAKPKHNVLAYSRAPKKNIILFDVDINDQVYLTPLQRQNEAHALGLECVPVLFDGTITSPEQLRAFLDTESVLGGVKIEGVVIKPAGYKLFGRDKKVLMGKFVSEAFKEVHQQEWTKEHKTPGGRDIIQLLSAKYATAARWQKAAQHLREAGNLEGSPRDIGNLMKEVQDDTLKECAEEIAKDLFQWAWPQLRRNITHGLPEWWKDFLMKLSFTPENQPENLLQKGD